MAITHISSVSQLNGILSKSNDKLSVIDFHATWCGPCHAIAPAFEALSKQYKDVNFLKCDVDAASDVAALYSVSAMPTFIFLKGSSKVDQVRGANRSALEEAIRKHATSSSSSSSSGNSFPGRGQTLGGDPAPATDEIRSTINNASNSITNLDPQLKVVLLLLGAYALFWYLG